MKILIVEDNETIRNELRIFLTRYNYEVDFLENFEKPVEDILEAKADLVLLDINLPIFDGYYICREIRKQSDVPIIIVTSRNSDMDELMSMNLGADDFVTKPYNTQILLARIASVLNRTYKSSQNDKNEFKGLSLYAQKSQAEYNGKTVDLTKNEVKILSILMKNKDNITSRDKIMEYLWQSDEFVDDNTLTVNVNRLRKKLEDIGAKNYIQTKRGQGYSL